MPFLLIYLVIIILDGYCKNAQFMASSRLYDTFVFIVSKNWKAAKPAEQTGWPIGLTFNLLSFTIYERLCSL
jgi:hypothetical protein